MLSLHSNESHGWLYEPNLLTLNDPPAYLEVLPYIITIVFVFVFLSVMYI